MLLCHKPCFCLLNLDSSTAKQLNKLVSLLRLKKISFPNALFVGLNTVKKLRFLLPMEAKLSSKRLRSGFPIISQPSKSPGQIMHPKVRHELRRFESLARIGLFRHFSTHHFLL